MPFSIENLAEIEAHLATHPTLTEGGAPGAVDATIFNALGSTFSSIQNSLTDRPTPTYTIGTCSSVHSHPLLFRNGLPQLNKPKLKRLKHPKLTMMTSIHLLMMLKYQPKKLKNPNPNP